MSTLVGRTVSYWQEKDPVRVVDWQPLASGMCDATIELSGGRRVCVASSDLRPLPGRPPLPSRKEAVEETRATALRQLRAVAQRRDVEFDHTPGGKLVRRALDAAVENLKRK